MKQFLIVFLIAFQFICSDNRSLYAQEPTVRGLIMEKSGVSKLANVSILNKRTDRFVQSDEYGLFRIPSLKGDTLSFSKSGFTDLIVVLPDLSDLVLRLQPVIRLSEVIVQGQSKKQELEEIKEQYRKKGSFYAGKPPWLAYIFQPLTTIYELVGKTPGQARRFNAYYSNELQQTEVDRRFNSNTVRKITGLDSLDLKNFMLAFRPDYSSLSTWDEYALINYITRSLQTFNISGRPKGIKSLPALPKAKDLTEKKLKY